MLNFVKSLLRQRTTWDAVLSEYLQSSQFRSLAPASQKPYRRVLESWMRDEQLGRKTVCSLTKRELEGMLTKRSRGAANFLFKRVRVLIRFAIERGHRNDDPTDGLECKPIGREHHMDR